MATLPSALQMSALAQARNGRADDIARLKLELELPDLEYVDISAELELRRALQRWPLLAELEAALPLETQRKAPQKVTT